MVAELQRRKYRVWFDLQNMKGSVLVRDRGASYSPHTQAGSEVCGMFVQDAMSEAVEGAELMLIGLSQKYKESANCRVRPVHKWAEL
eukprot:COSAG05_NODE_2639_length_2813_cov_1.688651_3_plen_87_part_00